MKKVAVVGLGYVGLPLAVLSSINNYEVIGLDLDKEKVDAINAGKNFIDDTFVGNNLKKGSITATDSPSSLAKADFILVCVPTPVRNDYQPDLGPLKGACTAIAENMSKDTVIIIESTVNPGVSEEIILPLLEEASGMKAGSDFYLSHCPERINPGDEKWTVQNIPRVVGSYDNKGLKKTIEFYESILDAEIKPMASLKEAEAVKVVENSFRDINIAFVNELAMSFNKLGIDAVNVINGAATKPFAFMPHYPGIGVGGHCIPVDPYYLIEYARQSGFEHDFLLLARHINNGMPGFTLELLVEGLNEVGLAMSKSKVAVLGLSYKANVGDDRESPSYRFIEHAKSHKAELVTYDPYIKKGSSVDSLDKALEGVDAVVVATSHREFVGLQADTLAEKGVKVVIDGRNCLDSKAIKDAGIVYKGVGTNA